MALRLLIPLKFNLKVFVYLVFTFIGFTVIGTLSHEGKMERDSFWITLGGPVQTILTGMIGILLLYFF